MSCTGPGGTSDEVSATLTVRPQTPTASAPDAPSRPTVTEGDEQLAVSWSAPDANGAAIDDYDVRYKRTSASSWRSHSFSGTGTSTTISSNLDNGLEYEVQVRAHNDEGESDWSASGTGTPRTVPAAPARPNISEGDEELAVSWTAPADNGAALTDYDVWYKRSSAASWTNHVFIGTGTRTTIGSNLTNGTEYAVRVRAQNAAGESDWSASATGTPRDEPDAPDAPALTPGNTQLAVSWRAPDANGAAIDEYEVEYKRNVTSVTTWSERTVTGTSATLTGLSNGVEYVVRVRAHNAAGWSGWSASATARPALVPTLTVSPETSTDGAYTVSWGIARCFSVPFGGGQVCRVLQERVGASGSWTAVSGVSTTATSHGVTGKADGTYYYRLVIGTGTTAVVVAGPASVTVAEDEDETEPPDAPDAPAVTTGTGQLTVSWDAPADNGAAIDEYEVAYKRNVASVTTWRTRTVTGTRATISSNLANGVEYAVRVKAHNSAGWSDESADATGTPLAAPGTPSGPATSTGAHTLTWDAVTGAAEYGIQARRNGGSWASAGTVTGTSDDLTAVATGSWDYQVRACNAGGCGDWSASLTLTVSTGVTLRVSPETSTDGAYTVDWGQRPVFYGVDLAGVPGAAGAGGR